MHLQARAMNRASCPSCTASLCPVLVPAARLGWNPRTSAQPQIAAGFLADARQHTLHCRARARVRLIARAEEAAYGTTWNIPQDSYIVLGLAHCFEKDDNGKLKDVMVIEPLAANSLEGMMAGTKTCFIIVTGLTLGEAMRRDKSALPEDFAAGRFCEDYEFRCEASARTWARPHAQDNLLDIVPLGSKRSKFNFNLDEKRVLNFENVVNDDDNIKQDMSIDVYGRKNEDDDEPQNGAAEAQPAKEEEEDDALDALLSG